MRAFSAPLNSTRHNDNGSFGNSAPLVAGAEDGGEQASSHDGHGPRQRRPNSPTQAAASSAAASRRGAQSKGRSAATVSFRSAGASDPIELQIEYMSAATGRVVFYSWYAMLLAALVLQSIVMLQWKATNLCGGASISLTDINAWHSPCAVNSTSPTNATHLDMVWFGSLGEAYDQRLNRFLHVIFSMAVPANITGESETFTLDFGVTVSGGGSSGGGVNRTATFTAEVLCTQGRERCDPVVVPTGATTRTNISDVTLALLDVTPRVAEAAGSAGVGAVYQRSGYTIATIFVRYTVMLLSILHFMRFHYRKKFTGTLHEQTWITFLHAGLFLYLDPLFAAGVYLVPEPSLLAFLEFRIPTYFLALMIAFMFSLLTSSMSWASLGGDGARDAHGTTQHLYDPPWGTKLAAGLYLALIFILDLVDASQSGWRWNVEHCPNFSCNTLGYVLYAALLLGILICTVWLWWLHNNLGQKPYLDTRPQQLACRVFIFLFSTVVVYFIAQSVTIVLLYRDISGIVTYQALVQVSPLLVASFFVNIMTFVYTTIVRTNRVPIRPKDPRWKRVVWPEAWHVWLARHGGSLYIFISESEERRFHEVQERYDQQRQALVLERNESLSEQFYTTLVVDDPSAPSLNAATAPAPMAAPGGNARVGGADSEANGADEAADRDGDDAAASDGDEDDEGQKQDDPDSPEAGRSPLRRGFRSVRRSVSRLMVTAEENLLLRPATLMDRIENAVVNRAAAVLRLNARKPFFNLEMAIDCFNLSWEAYGVESSRGDEMIQTGLNVTLPEASLRDATRWRAQVCSPWWCPSRCCCGGDDSDGNGDDGRARSPTSVSPGAELDADPQHGGGGHQRPEYGATMLPSPTSGQPKAPPIDVEQYGYRRLAVCERANVQVVISRIRLDTARHAGKLDRIVVAFRGTDNLANARQDLKIARVAWHEVEDTTLWQTTTRNRASVHEGFLGIWSALREFVVETIVAETLRAGESDQGFNVVVTGHSMGGAVSVLCAYVLQKVLRNLRHAQYQPIVYTYGQPRIGNKSFQRAYNKAVPHTFRVVNESDAVSSITMFGGCHVGMEVDIDRNGNYICDPMFVERTFRPTKGKGSALANHGMVAYADSLNAIAAAAERNSGRDGANGGGGGGACPSRCLQPYVPLVPEVPTSPASTTTPPPPLPPVPLPPPRER